MRIVMCLLLATLFQNCSGQKKFEKNIQPLFTNIFDTTDKGLSGLIDIDGIYLVREKNDTSRNIESGYKFLFFRDGSFINVFSLVDKITLNEQSNVWETPFEEAKYKLTNGGFGYYAISNDTIRSFAVNRPRFGIPTPLVRLLFKIIDRTHLQLIGYRRSDGTYINSEIEYCTGEFKKWKKLPPSTNWLMYQSWYWKNQKDWEVFMKTKNGK